MIGGHLKHLTAATAATSERQIKKNKVDNVPTYYTLSFKNKSQKVHTCITTLDPTYSALSKKCLLHFPEK